VKILNSLLDIKSSDDLKSLEDFYFNKESNQIDDNLNKSVNRFMSVGINRIVIVESDNPESGFVSDLVRYIKDNRLYSNRLYALQENDLDLYKENIEIIKYINRWINYEVNETNLKSLFYEVFSHIGMLDKKGDNLDVLQNLTTQQLDVKSVFTVERITLTNLAERIRFLLFLDFADENKNHLLMRLSDMVDKSIGRKNNPLPDYYKKYALLNINYGDVVKKLKYYIENKEEDALLNYYLKQNLREVNSYLTKSLFIWHKLNWEEINKVFRENRLTLSSGLNSKKKR